MHFKCGYNYLFIYASAWWRHWCLYGQKLFLIRCSSFIELFFHTAGSFEMFSTVKDNHNSEWVYLYMNICPWPAFSPRHWHVRRVRLPSHDRRRAGPAGAAAQSGDAHQVSPAHITHISQWNWRWWEVIIEGLSLLPVSFLLLFWTCLIVCG